MSTVLEKEECIPFPNREHAKENQGPTRLYVGAFSPTSTSMLRCLLPSSVNLDSLCTTTPEGIRWPAKQRHKLAFVLHRIVRGSYEQHSGSDDSKAHGVPINAAYLRSLLGKGRRDFAKEALNTLAEWGIIECAGKHRAGHYSRSYRLTEAHRCSRLAWCVFDAPRLAEKLQADTATSSETAAESSPAFAFIRENLNAVTLSAEGYRDAEQRIQSFSDPRKQAAWMLTLESLREPSASFHYSEETGRVYHCVANCPKDLRRHLLVDGEPSAEVDISSSQFYLLLGLYPKSSPERKRFGYAVSSGHFYEYLRILTGGFGDAPVTGDVTQVWNGPNGAAERAAFKELAIRKILYERLYESTAATGVWLAFQHSFPELAGELALRRHSRPATRAFCCEMQRREAELVLHRAIPRIQGELAGCKPVSIHDGILCQKKFAERVAAIVTQEGSHHYGALPCVKITGDPADR